VTTSFPSDVQKDDRGVKDDLPRLDPIGLDFQRRSVFFPFLILAPDDFWFELPEPIEVTRGLLAGSVPGILLVNRPHRDLVDLRMQVVPALLI